MKKIISLATLSILVAVSVLSIISLPQVTAAQNVGSSQSIVTPGFSFRKDLRLGDTDPDVLQLQKVLNSSPDTVVNTLNSNEPASPGHETTYFGELTKLAVIKFQNKFASTILTPYGLTIGNGIINRATRAKLNLLIGVLITTDSVGVPQSRASLATSTSPIATSSPVQSQTTVCNFVELLVNISAIVPEKAPAARLALNCSPSPVVSTPQQMSSCQFVELLINIGAIAPEKIIPARTALNCSQITNASYVDLKVNGQDGPITVPANSIVSLSWTSSGVISCTSGGSIKTISGSQQYNLGAAGSGIFPISCQTANGTTVSDSVTVNVGTASQIAASQLSVSCTVSPASVVIGNPVYWQAVVSGDSDDVLAKTYSWSGSESLTGSTLSLSKTYSSVGTKSGTITVASNGTTKTATCYATATTLPVVATTTATSTVITATSTATTTPMIKPIIYAFYAVPGETSAVVHLYTNKPVIATVYYGKQSRIITILSTTTASSTTATTTNTISTTTSTYANARSTTVASTTSVYTMANLTASTTYYYLLKVTDINGNYTTTTEQTFMTLASMSAAGVTTEPEESLVARTQLGGIISGVFDCYDDSGVNKKDRFKMVIVQSCNGNPVIGGDFILNVDTGETKPGENNPDFGVGVEGAVKFLWDRVDGNPLPVVGETIMGTGAPKADAFGEKCTKVGNGSGVVLSSSEFGGTDGGWVIENQPGTTADCAVQCPLGVIYEPGSPCATASNNGGDGNSLFVDTRDSAATGAEIGAFLPGVGPVVGAGIGAGVGAIRHILGW